MEISKRSLMGFVLYQACDFVQFSLLLGFQFLCIFDEHMTLTSIRLFTMMEVRHLDEQHVLSVQSLLSPIWPSKLPKDQLPIFFPL